jgi:DNA-binding response OmpR family regulator
MSRVLIVEDEAHLANGLRYNLEAESHTVKVVGDGEAALTLLIDKRQDFDAVVLDVMLPGKDGFTVASELRAARNFVPVLMLTARARPEDVLKGFASGADDYLPKPFELPILLARLQGLLRRYEWMRGAVPPKQNGTPEYEVFSFAGRTIDFGKLELHVRGNTTQLTLMEGELLRYLVRNQGKVVSRKSILEEVWGLHEDTDTRAIDNFIVRLRKYIENDPADPEFLLTVRGVGYKFVADPDD